MCAATPDLFVLPINKIAPPKVGQCIVVFALLAADVVRESVFVTSTLVDTFINLDGK